MKYDLEELQKFITVNDIPEVKGQPKTFLGIAKQPHYENVISNIYAFYFEINEVHHLKDLFISSLLEIINHKEQIMETFVNYEVYTEFGVSKQKRIDILLKNIDQAIIIENKVYHHLNNDLACYYNDVNVPQKLGVVLSLYPIANVKHPHFINITHLDFLSEVINNLKKYQLHAKDKYVVFLKDLHQNIINISQPVMHEKEFNFYFENQKKINHLISYKSQARVHIEHKVKKTFYRLQEDLQIKLNESKGQLGNKLSYFESEINKNLVITIIYGDLLKRDKKLRLKIELKGEAIKDKEIYRELNLKGIDNEYFYNSKSKNIVPFLIQEFELTSHQIWDLDHVLYKNLHEYGFVNVFEKLQSFQIEKS